MLPTSSAISNAWLKRIYRLPCCKAELQAIYEKYRADILLYQASPIAVRRAENVFDNIFTMRNNSARNFSPSYLEKKSKIRNFIQPINWLTMNNVINKAYRLKGEISLPLRYSSENSFRLYLADVGLLALQSGIRGTAFISPNRGEMLPQTLFEAYIANELAAQGIPVFYWLGSEHSELNFVVELQGKLYPIAVSQGKETTNSLRKFRNSNQYKTAITVTDKPLAHRSNERTNIPYYLVPFMANRFFDKH